MASQLWIEPITKWVKAKPKFIVVQNES